MGRELQGRGEKRGKNETAVITVNEIYFKKGKK